MQGADVNYRWITTEKWAESFLGYSQYNFGKRSLCMVTHILFHCRFQHWLGNQRTMRKHLILHCIIYPLIIIFDDSVWYYGRSKFPQSKLCGLKSICQVIVSVRRNMILIMFWQQKYSYNSLGRIAFLVYVYKKPFVHFYDKWNTFYCKMLSINLKV